ncbi:MAG TPA: Hsp20/alpha crystallin family protein [Ktedonobacterales bacterium]|jgi:HSP20 family protein|nr:Hsp20/alpha crystallin family protein [Ktedonobacterales bacterium]
MSSITRWDPFRDATTLRDAMGQLFEQAVLRPGAFGSVVGQMNVLEADGHFIVQALLPGVRHEDIDLTVRQNVLTMKASTSETLPQEHLKTATWLLREFGPGEFTRTITFNKDVDGDKVDAHFDRGVLTLVVPLAQHAQPKRIAVREADSAPERLLVDEQANTRQPATVS